MKKRVIVDILSIVVIYAIYWTIIIVGALPDYDFPGGMGITAVDAEQFLEDFKVWSQLVMGVSLVATFGWYVVGEWGPKPHTTRASTWLLIWFLGLVVALGGGFLGSWFGPVPSENREVLAAFYVVSAALFFYLATLLFSPVNVKYVVPGSKWIRRW